jgi:threonine synthase
MKLISTRGHSKASFSQAVQMGLAKDGGLFVPLTWPRLQKSHFYDNSFSSIAYVVLNAFLKNALNEEQLKKLVTEAFDFPISLQTLDNRHSLLELFHGPTAAFKDVAAQFLAAYMNLAITEEQIILVATSGDTGGAIASALHKNKKFRVIIFFPKNGVSPLQKQQLTCWGENVTAVAVNGTFDDCQKIVKQSLADLNLASFRLTSANSINIARILPQVCYHAAAAIWYDNLNSCGCNLIIPSGNLGNAVAAFWARAVGLPIQFIGLATNKNKTLKNYYESGLYLPQRSQSSLANAMDVGDPSNFERLTHLVGNLRDLKQISEVQCFEDDEIKYYIDFAYKKWKKIICPHTATAVGFSQNHPERNWLICATAHAAKFREIVEPILGFQVPVPETLKKLYELPSQFIDFEPGQAIIDILKK